MMGPPNNWDPYWMLSTCTQESHISCNHMNSVDMAIARPHRRGGDYKTPWWMLHKWNFPTSLQEKKIKVLQDIHASMVVTILLASLSNSLSLLFLNQVECYNTFLVPSQHLTPNCALVPASAITLITVLHIVTIVNIHNSWFLFLECVWQLHIPLRSIAFNGQLMALLASFVTHCAWRAVVLNYWLLKTE